MVLAPAEIVSQLHDSAITFRAVIVDAVSEEWAAHIVDSESMTTREIFAFAFADEGRVDALFAGGNAPVAAIAQKGVIRLIWSVARAMCRAVITSVERVAEDTALGVTTDEPISPGDRDALLLQFASRYHVKLAPEEQPNRTLLGKLFREARVRTMTFVDLALVKSLVATQCESEKKRHKLGDGSFTISAVTQDEEPTRVEGGADFLHRLQILMNGYALVGTRETQGAQWFALQAAHSYMLVFRRLMVSHGLAYCRSADEQLRLFILDSVINGSQLAGSAFSDALSTMRHVTNPLPVSIPRTVMPGADLGSRNAKRRRPTSDAPLARTPGLQQPNGRSTFDPRSRVRTGQHTASKQLVCKWFNDNRNGKGCQRPNCDRKHVCDVLTESGTICGGQHRRIDHKV
jgi:hypothetical protein